MLPAYGYVGYVWKTSSNLHRRTQSGRLSPIPRFFTSTWLRVLARHSNMHFHWEEGFAFLLEKLIDYNVMHRKTKNVDWFLQI